MSADKVHSELFELAVQLHQAGELDQASEKYLEILSHNPSHAEAMHLLGVIAAQNGNLNITILSRVPLKI